MVHLAALPGTTGSELTPSQIEKRAVQEAKILRDAGVHGLMIENMHDTPYLRGRVGPEIVAVMAIIARAVKETAQLPCGVQILAGANLEAMGVAHAAGLDFIRAEGFAFAHVADEGFIQSSAAELLRFRRAIGADNVQVWTDVKKKHSSHAITADVDIGETAHAVEFMRGDAVIVTGAVTGDAPQETDLLAVTKRACPFIWAPASPPQTSKHFLWTRTDLLSVRNSNAADVGPHRWMQSAWNVSWQRIGS